MRFLTRSLIGLFLAAVTIALLVGAGWTFKTALDIRNAGGKGFRPAAERAFAARVERLTPGTVVPQLVTFGRIESRRRLELRAAASGQITELSPDFENGGRVKAGTLLLRIDPSDAQSALDLARANLTEAEIELHDARRALKLASDDLAAAEQQLDLRRRALDRQTGIADRGFGTATDLEQAELAVSNAIQSVVSRRQALAQAEARASRAETALERAKLALADAERRLAETEIRAGFDGVLAEASAVRGGLVAVNEKLGELIDPDALEVSFRVSTTQFSRLVDGGGRLKPLSATVALGTDQGDLVATARLVRVDASVSDGASGRRIFATLERPGGFQPGDFVAIRIAEDPVGDAARIPAAAVGADGTILLVGPGDRLEAAPVEILHREEDDVIIRVGALAGREAVMERTALLGAGILIKPIRPAAPAGLPSDEDSLLLLPPDRRQALIDFVTTSAALSAEARAELLAKLRAERVPAEIVSRIEARMGG
ncbi:efflux RND transporter periplasmic adaptor subunit [Albidovulum sp.]